MLFIASSGKLLGKFGGYHPWGRFYGTANGGKLLKKFGGSTIGGSSEPPFFMSKARLNGVIISVFTGAQELKKESTPFLSIEVSRPARKRHHRRDGILSRIPPPAPPAAVGVVHVRARRRRRVRRGWLSESFQLVTGCHGLVLCSI